MHRRGKQGRGDEVETGERGRWMLKSVAARFLGSTLLLTILLVASLRMGGGASLTVAGAAAVLFSFLEFLLFYVLVLRPLNRMRLLAGNLGGGGVAGEERPQLSKEFADVAEAMLSTSAVVKRFLESADKCLDAWRNRDMTRPTETGISGGDSGFRLDSSLAQFSVTNSQLATDLATIKVGLIDASTTVASVIGLINDLGVSTQGQADELGGIARSVEENTHAIRNIAEIGQHTKESVDHIVGAITGIASQMSVLLESINRIQDSTTRITGIVTIIQDIADQTNLLALNAAIEAARAGDQGRGFAVVADEVRKLAERVAHATQDVVRLIKEAETRMNAGVGVVTEIVSSNRQVHEQASQIKASIDSLASAVEQQSASMRSLSDSAGRITAQADSIRNSTAEITEIVGKMVGSMDEASGVVNSYKM